MLKKIVIKGAKEHNLKNISLEIPKDKFIVITGLSGSGKSSLAFDTIYAEGQRRYVESLSAYARQFLDKMKKIIREIRGDQTPKEEKNEEFIEEKEAPKKESDSKKQEIQHDDNPRRRNIFENNRSIKTHLNRFSGFPGKKPDKDS